MKNIQAILESERKQREAYLSYKRSNKQFFKKKKRKQPRSIQVVVPKTYKPRQVLDGRQYTLYALRLEQDKYYIGMTTYHAVEQRMAEHIEAGKRGAIWTAKYSPIEILETRVVGTIGKSASARLENDMTIEYIEKYGMNNVRGGDMCSLNLKAVMRNYQRHINFRTRKEHQEKFEQELIAKELSWIN